MAVTGELQFADYAPVDGVDAVAVVVIEHDTADGVERLVIGAKAGAIVAVEIDGFTTDNAVDAVAEVAYEVFTGANDVDAFYSGRGDDVINAGFADDIIHGGNGSDTIYAGEGNTASAV